MQVKDLKAKQGNVEIVLDVIDVGEARSFEKFGKAGKVATAVAKDETGDVKITLWNDDIEKVKAGDKIKIANGYVSEWQGEIQLTTGRFGKIEVIGESEENIKEMTKGPDIEEDKKIYRESEEKLKKIEEDLEEEPSYDEEDVEDK